LTKKILTYFLLHFFQFIFSIHLFPSPIFEQKKIFSKRLAILIFYHFSKKRFFPQKFGYPNFLPLFPKRNFSKSLALPIFCHFLRLLSVDSQTLLTLSSNFRKINTEKKLSQVFLKKSILKKKLWIHIRSSDMKI